ncbi:MAG: hypothetical protein WC428_00350 [Candidatus Paceibacterota bacterium]
MIDFFKRIYFWIYIKIHTILINIGIMLYRAEADMIADPNNIQEGDKRIQRMLHRNQTLEKFYAGKTDEKYVQEYYEILKKADKFIRNATPRQMALAADRHGSSYAQKDQYGRRYEHFGFYDEKHKNAGKTIGEVLVQEFEERRLKDDDYELLHIFNNKPIEVGLEKIMNVVKKTDKENTEFEFEVMDISEKSKTFEFPIKIIRENENVVNKIEQLTEFLHVKKIGFDYRQLEFLIPLKYKTNDFEEDTNIFKELTNIKEVYLRDDYGELIGYGVIKFIKRIKYNDTHDVLKFEAIEMQNMRT